jgi:transcription elongation factor GreA
MANTYYITKEKLEQIRKEYEAIKKALQEEISGDIPNFLESNDPNPDFYLFEQNFEDLNSRAEVLENILKNYTIIKSPPRQDQDRVQLGARVIFSNGSANQEEYKIVGTIEANPFEGKISNESPVGMAFLGKKVGDIINLPINKKNYKILRIDYKDA